MGIMAFAQLREWLGNLTWSDVDMWFEKYEALGPLPGILLPLLESLLPFLPLIAIVIANAEAYGFWEGFLYSWIGSVCGSIIVFWFIRLIGGRLRRWIERSLHKSERFIGWVERRGFSVLFILSCFPFTPTSLLNVLSALSTVSFRTYVTAIGLGKGVMVFLITFVGYDLSLLFRSPWKLVLSVALLLVMWVVGRHLESRFTR